MRYQWLLFDADGTLFDYDAAESKALKAVFNQFSIPFSPESENSYRRINRQVWRDLEQGKISTASLRTIRFERLFCELALEADINRVAAAYLEHLSQQADLIEGACSLIENLSRHYQLAMITNGLKEVQRPRFTNSGVGAYFSVIVISDEVGVAKPDSAYFDIVFREMRYPPKDQALVVGDSLDSDIQGGMNYGLDTCWFNPHKKPNPSERQPTYEIQSLHELHRIL
jgi:2-haloacid dehalogenase